MSNIITPSRSDGGVFARSPGLVRASLDYGSVPEGVSWFYSYNYKSFPLIFSHPNAQLMSGVVPDAGYSTGPWNNPPYQYYSPYANITMPYGGYLRPQGSTNTAASPISPLCPSGSRVVTWSSDDTGMNTSARSGSGLITSFPHSARMWVDVGSYSTFTLGSASGPFGGAINLETHLLIRFNTKKRIRINSGSWITLMPGVIYRYDGWHTTTPDTFHCLGYYLSVWSGLPVTWPPGDPYNDWKTEYGIPIGTRSVYTFDLSIEVQAA